MRAVNIEYLSFTCAKVRTGVARISRGMHGYLSKRGSMYGEFG